MLFQLYQDDDKRESNIFTHYTSVYCISKCLTSLVRLTKVGEYLIDDGQVWWEEMHKLIHIFNNL